LLILALEQENDILNGTCVVLIVTQSGNTGPQTTFDVVLETRPFQRTVDFDAASSQQEVSVNDLYRIPGQGSRKIGPKVAGPIVADSSSQENPWKRFSGREFYMQKRLVVFQPYVELRLSPLDQAAFKKESFNLAVGNNELEVADCSLEIAGFRIRIAFRTEVRSYSGAQILGFADVDDLPVPVPENVDTRSLG
jgi:hypothetical protein